MKKLSVGLCLFATTLFAAGGRDDAVRERMSLRSRAMAEIAPTAISQSKATTWIFIPAAASSAGGFGTFYRSDVMIANYRSVPQVVRARWIPAGGDGFSTSTVKVTVPANSAVSYSDFVSSVLHQSGLGTIELVARDASDTIDLDAKIDAFSRIWTPQPNSTAGSVSQDFAGLYIFQIEGTDPAHAIGLRQDDKFRTNVGIVNLDFFDAHTWRIDVIGTRGTTSMNITVPSFSMIQTNIPGGNWGDVAITFTPDSAMSFENWMAYAASSDSGTNDGWVSIATQIGK
ncbi:MAG TPA: hypothetical protein VGS96_20075 [Thermoanaerobaculia bacterium]|jgi:hypothetical protein|nr:hypothetical protein [Thermoanaerobaculia bacterium]